MEEKDRITKKKSCAIIKNISIVWFHVKMNWIMLFIVKVFNIIGRIRKDTGVYAGVFFCLRAMVVSEDRRKCL